MAHVDEIEMVAQNEAEKKLRLLPGQCDMSKFEEAQKLITSKLENDKATFKQSFYAKSSFCLTK